MGRPLNKNKTYECTYRNRRATLYYSFLKECWAIDWKGVFTFPTYLKEEDLVNVTIIKNGRP